MIQAQAADGSYTPLRMHVDPSWLPLNVALNGARSQASEGGSVEYEGEAPNPNLNPRPDPNPYETPWVQKYAPPQSIGRERPLSEGGGVRVCVVQTPWRDPGRVPPCRTPHVLGLCLFTTYPYPYVAVPT